MMVYNTYIDQLSKRSKVFFIKIQDLEYISKIFGIIIEMKSKFAKEIKARDNWK